MTPKFKRRLRIIRLFSPGYNPRARVDGTIEPFDGPKVTGEPVSAEEAFFIWESRGAVAECYEPEALKKLVEQKAMMDLCVSMWRDQFEFYRREVYIKQITRWPMFTELCELTDKYPVSFLREIGLLDFGNITVKELGYCKARVRAALR